MTASPVSAQIPPGVRGVLLACTLLLAGCGASSSAGGGGSADPFEADWLDGEPTISPAHLGRVLAMGERDPEVAALFHEALARLGGGRVEGLAARFSPCAQGVTNEGGFTSVKSSDAWLPRSLEELGLGRRPPEAAQELAKLRSGPSRDGRVVTYPDFIFIERTLLPEICVVPRLPLVEAYETIVHELVHALHIDPRAKAALAAGARDDRGYDLGFVLIAGGEVEAYARSGRARLRSGYRGARLSPVQLLFDPRTAELMFPPGAVADMILAPAPGGLGYATGLLRNAFEEARRDRTGSLASKRGVFDKVLAERRANIPILASNIDVHTHNLEAHRHNLGIATTRGDKGLAAKSRAGVEEAERGLTETRAMLDAAHASETRLVADLASIDAELPGNAPQGSSQ